MISLKAKVKYGKWAKKGFVEKIALDAGLAAAKIYTDELSKVLGVQGSPTNRSKPGEPPRKQTGDLQAEAELSTSVEIVNKQVHIKIQSFTEKAAALERGTWKMAPRPAWIPTFEKVHGEMKRAAKNEFRRNLR